MNFYHEQSCAVIFKTSEKFGELSNMHSGFPIIWDDRLVYSSEALYQSFRFEQGSKANRHVLSIKNPFESKRVAYRYLDETRSDWDDAKLDIMDMCLRLKYEQHQEYLKNILINTLGQPIVEKSFKDQIWGAVHVQKNVLYGLNLLGGLWEIIRNEYI
jgi:ribA/ribD-fused uncharacterized protein